MVAPWWRGAILYQIYVRSWIDSNGDGIGDLPGVIRGLDHLTSLGVEGIWLSPITVSPDADWGYDVSDYCRVQDVLGDLGDVDALIREAGARGIRVLLDLVPNHTSEHHPWFIDSRSSRSSRHRDWYVWADPGPGGAPPNNWLSSFGGSAWTLDDRTGQFYLHNFLHSQPDLNWWNEEVRAAFDEILRFWFDRGVAGFRIDVAHAMIKDRELRDNPPILEEDHPQLRRLGQRPIYSMNRPEVHDVLRSWRSIADEYDPPRVLIGETWVLDLNAMAAFYGTGRDELHMAFNFPFLFSPFEAAALRHMVESAEASIPKGGWPVWTLSNHDAGRFPTRWCDEDDVRVRCALMTLLTLRGTPVLYYGDEIGMGQTALPYEHLRDAVSERDWPESSRDGARTPMQWSPEAGAGFTQAGVTPWLPFGDHAARNVAAQRSDPSSLLSLCRDLAVLRRGRADLRDAPYESLPAPAGVWAWRRGSRVAVALNLGDVGALLEGLDGTVLIGTSRERDGESLDGGLSLRPSEGVVVELRR
ncbi:alpha-amylase family glycosyl hydrolase [soil metagenome]